MSVAGKMLINDPRNNLIKYVIKFIKITRPNNILIENVPPILNFPIYIGRKKIRISEYIKNELLQYKYHIKMEILDAADFRTPQHRKRAIILHFEKEMRITKKT